MKMKIYGIKVEEVLKDYNVDKYLKNGACWMEANIECRGSGTLTPYYSIDFGNTWIPLTDIITLTSDWSKFVVGFEVNDVLISLYKLIEQIVTNKPAVDNTYGRIVKPEGNVRAKEFLGQVFDQSDSLWRGIGKIPQSGYTLKPEYQQYDAALRFDIKIDTEIKMPDGCSCDQVLVGKITPTECPLFATSCTPRNPIGPCMVSHEGSCKIAFLFQSPD